MHIYAVTPLFQVVIVQSITSVEPMEQVLTHSAYAPWFVPICLIKVAVLQALIVQVSIKLKLFSSI